jgi:ribosomal protein S17
MKNLLWFIVKIFIDNHGYDTPRQERFKIGERVQISKFRRHPMFNKVGEIVTIIETRRYDYLIENSLGIRCILYQFELNKL